MYRISHIVLLVVLAVVAVVAVVALTAVTATTAVTAWQCNGNGDDNGDDNDNSNDNGDDNGDDNGNGDGTAGGGTLDQAQTSSAAYIRSYAKTFFKFVAIYNHLSHFHISTFTQASTCL